MLKALVLCAGRGSRLRPLTHTRAKASVPVAGVPVLSHVLSYLGRHGFSDIGVVIGPEQEALRTLADDGITWVVQHQPLGIAHAVRAAGSFLGAAPFLLYLGDNLTNEDLQPALARFTAERPAAMITVRPVANPQAFGIAEVQGDQVVRVVEKPAVPSSNLAIAGIYLFAPAIHDAIAKVAPSARGEYEITDAIAVLLGDGRPVLMHRIGGWWQDMGSMEGILAANAHLLDQVEPEIDETASLAEVTMEGKVRIGARSVLKRVRLRGPVLIGADSRLSDVEIGPYTSLGEATTMESTAVENSILLPGCRVLGSPFPLEGCLLGSGATVGIAKGGSVSLYLGDDARLMIPGRSGVTRGGLL